MFGWSALIYGSELWPLLADDLLQKAQAHIVHIALGITFTTNYWALCWYVGILPARFTVISKALMFLYRLGHSKIQYGQDSLHALVDMWMVLTGSGTQPASAY